MGKTRRLIGLVFSAVVGMGFAEFESHFLGVESVELSARMDVEIAHGAGQTDATLSTVELGVGVESMGGFRADAIFLYEEDETEPMELDQLFVTWSAPEQSLSVQLGQYYMPFGNLETRFVSDPVLLELSECREKGATLQFQPGSVAASLSLFKSDVDADADYNAVAALRGQFGEEGATIEAGGSLIYNLLDADGLADLLDELGGGSDDEVAGANVWITATRGRVTLIAEAVQSLESMRWDGASRRPSSMNVELAYDCTDSFAVGAKCERSDDVPEELAELRYGAVCSRALYEGEAGSLGVALEYLREEFDGGESGDLFTLQFAAEF